MRLRYYLSFNLKVKQKCNEKLKSSLDNSDGDDREELDEDARHEETRETNDTPTTTNHIF
jgi:hypothetical protein